MKTQKTLLVLAILITSLSFGQNIFPTTGNVGIGTSTPNSRLDLGSGYGVNGAKLLIYNDNTASELSGTKCGFYMDNFTLNNLNLVFPEAASFPGLFTISAKNTSGTTLNPYFSIAGLTGNVGIGTTTPAAKLHIQNAGINGQLDYNLIIQKTLVADSNKSAVGLLFSTEGYGSFGKSAIVHERTGGYGIGNLYFLNNNAIDPSNPTLLDAKMAINSNGNVGIGTTSPNSKLTIRSGSSGVSIHPGGNPYFGTLAFNRESATGEIFDATGQAFQINNGGNDKNLHFQVYNGNGSQITDNALVISGTNGNVGIGTANPTAKLTVAGDINSREVRVTVDAGADFVFENDYDLPSLITVENYIKENKHLPEIASAKEMQTNGMNLSEMNIKLLQKVEELTLYTIEQEKKNNIQSKKIEALEKENEAFKSLSERLSKLENQSN